MDGGLFEHVGELQLQRFDDMDYFTSDEAAWAFVAASAYTGDRLSMRAIAVLQRDSTEEYLRIVRRVGFEPRAAA